MRPRALEHNDGKPHRLDRQRARAWTLVGLMMACIAVLLPVTPGLWQTGIDVFGSGFNAVGYGGLILVATCLAIYVIFRRPRVRAPDIAVLIVLIAVYAYLMIYHCQFPAERLHLIEYGVLAYLVYRALRLDIWERSAYLMSFLICSGFGLLDEAIQFLLPNRVFEIRDVMTNVYASGLGLVVVVLLLRSADGGSHEQMKYS